MNKDPKISTIKQIQCLCDNPLCAKCLAVNCLDQNCPTHTPAKKLQWSQRILKNTEEGTVLTNEEITKLKDVQKIVRAELAKKPGDTTRMSIQEIKRLAESVGVVTDNNTDGESPEEREKI